MPGFCLVSPQAADAKPRTTYAWELTQLFGETSSSKKALIPLKDCSTPTISMAKEEVPGSSLVYKYASQANWEDVKLTFYDIPQGGNRLVDLMRQWRQRVWSAAKGIGQAHVSGSDTAGYKQDSFIQIRDLEFSNDYYTWQLFGSWPGVIADGELSYTTSDIKIVSITVVYDWAETK